MFISKYNKVFSQYYELRSAVLSDSARKHELCYLKRFDKYIADSIQSDEDVLLESFMCKWISSLRGSSVSIANEVIVIRQFLKYLNLNGHSAFIPVIPKVHDDYAPYIFSDTELELIFSAADNTTVKNKTACIYLPVEFPVILRLLFSCGYCAGILCTVYMLGYGELDLLPTQSFHVANFAGQSVDIRGHDADRDRYSVQKTDVCLFCQHHVCIPVCFYALYPVGRHLSLSGAD